MTHFLNFQYSDQLMLILLMLGCIGFGIILHVAWMWNDRPRIDIYDLWKAIGPRDRDKFIDALIQLYGYKICGMIQAIKKCKPDIPVITPEDLKGGKDVE